MAAGKIHIFAWILAATLALVGCASQGSIYGGPKDTTPPKVLAEKSTPNEQTHFAERKITLRFDEYVVVQNALKEMVISPPLRQVPKIESRGKKVTFSFHPDEELKENATYSINFGKSIKDFRAGNPIGNYSFVFSTGDYIDSLNIAGKVVDSKTDKAQADVLVMLYDDLRDSVPYLARPFYSTRTDKNGRFRLDHLRADTFKIFALADANVNYLYDQPGEAIGYLDSVLVLSADQAQDNIVLETFIEAQARKIIDTDDKQAGIVRIVFDQAAAGVDYRIEPSRDDIVSHTDGDTLLLYYPVDMPFGESQVLIGEDTLTLRQARENSKPPRLKIEDDRRIEIKGLYPLDTLTWASSTPLKALVMDSIQVTDTSGQNYPLTDWTEPTQRRLYIGSDLPPSSVPYTLTMLPGAVTDLYNQTNRDTLRYSFKKVAEDDTGTILLNFSPLLADSNHYLIHITGSDLSRRIRTQELQDSIVTLQNIAPGAYKVDLIWDQNGNGRQDEGNYLAREKADPERSISLQALKAEWTLEADIAWPTDETAPKADGKAPERPPFQSPKVPKEKKE